MIAVYIGRFQPFHNGHMKVVKHALCNYRKLIICLGSAQESGTAKNPFTPYERLKLIRGALTPEENLAVEFRYIWDQQTDKEWAYEVICQVGHPNNVTLLCPRTDESSYYLDLFPCWAKDEIDFPGPKVHAETIRSYWQAGSVMTTCVPANVAEYLSNVDHPENRLV